MVKLRLSEEEYAVLSAAAERERLANGAFAAQAALAAARGTARPEYALLRESLIAVMHSAGQARRIGINFNQAVAALHSGELSDQLRWYAEVSARTVGKLDDLAEEIRARLP
ncbi:hypothetical protein SMC26_24110 [Actinomadura fulvescens]|uniref:Mobilization protein n=1 Tax=Actinomadura fulvescens TaxID=46160 RepID=A0ABN3Q2R6_9ACTN